MHQVISDYGFHYTQIDSANNQQVEITLNVFQQYVDRFDLKW